MISFTDEWSGVQFISDNFLEILQEYHPNPDDVDREYPFCSMALGKLIENNGKVFLFNYKEMIITCFSQVCKTIY